MERKKIIITGCYHSMNTGVMAMAETIIQQFSESEIYILTSKEYFEKDEERYGIYSNVKLINSDWLVLNGFYNKVKLIPGLFGISLYPNINKVLYDTDLIIDISGDSISNDYGTKSVFFSLFLNFISKKSNKFIFAPQTLGPFDKGIQSYIVQKALKKAFKVYLREEESLKKLHGINVKIEAVLADLAFLLNPKPITLNIPIPKKTIAVGVSALISKFGRKDSIDLFKNVVELCLDKGYNVLLVNHVSTLQGNDIEVAKSVKEGFFISDERVLFFNDNFRASEWKYIIGQCDAIVSARMHPIVHALSQGVPALNLSYNHKSIGVVHNRFYPYGDNVDILDGKLLHKISKFVDHLGKVDRINFADKIEKNRQLAYQFITEIKQIK